jgi:NAD(P)-dependent dehydrogenase (short-subunit alcohol dehydrogenase family)
VAWERTHTEARVTREPRASKVALLTGASAGLGDALCARLVRRGWRVVAASRRGTSSQTSPLVRPVTLDVTDAETFAACIRRTIEQEGRLDALILNAGINVPAPIEELPLDTARAIMETKFWGVVHGVNGALGHFRERREGTVLVVGSLAGLASIPGQAIYAASKYALEGWLEGLQYEVSRFGIRVRLAEPGYIRTELATSAERHEETIADYDDVRSQLFAQWSENLEKGMSPDSAAERLVRLLEARRAPFRTRIGSEAVWLPRMKALLPEAWFFAGARRAFGLNETPPSPNHRSGPRAPNGGSDGTAPATTVSEPPSLNLPPPAPR